MKCTNNDIKELLPAYASGEADADTRRLVDGHLASCEDCRQEFGILVTLSAEAVPDPGEAFWRELPARIEREVRLQRSAPRKRFDLSRLLDRILLPRWAWAAAAVAAVVLASWLLITPRNGEWPALHEVYDSGYGSTHDPVLTHPSTNMSDLSDNQVTTIDTWAGRELAAMASEASFVPATQDKDEYEDLAELNGREIEKLSTILKYYAEEG